MRVATVIPNSPANIGLIQAACVIALHDVSGLERNDATTFSFVLFLALTLPLLAGGAIATALTGLNIGEIHHHARQRMHATETKPPELHRRPEPDCQKQSAKKKGRRRPQPYSRLEPVGLLGAARSHSSLESARASRVCEGSNCG